MDKGKKTVSAKADAKLRERIKEYEEEYGLSKSDAVRELIREGLDKQEEEKKIPPSAMLTAAGIFLAGVGVEPGTTLPPGVMFLAGMTIATIGMIIMSGEGRFRQTLR